MDMFKKGVDFTFRWEGIYSNDKDDPGGPTKYGITLATLQDAGKDLNQDGIVDIEDIKQLTLEDSKQIYKERYWDAMGCDQLVEKGDWPMALVAFDTAVNCGVSRTTRWLREVQDKGQTYISLLNFRVIHYLNLINKRPVMAKYKNGWMNRVNDLKKYIDILKTENE